MPSGDVVDQLLKKSKVDRTPKADPLLHFIPLSPCPRRREILLWLGNVDAAAPTAKVHLRKKRSLLIFVGGEKEQLMTSPGVHRV